MKRQKKLITLVTLFPLGMALFLGQPCFADKRTSIWGKGGDLEDHSGPVVIVDEQIRKEPETVDELKTKVRGQIQELIAKNVSRDDIEASLRTVQGINPSSSGKVDFRASAAAQIPELEEMRNSFVRLVELSKKEDRDFNPETLIVDLTQPIGDSNREGQRQDASAPSPSGEKPQSPKPEQADAKPEKPQKPNTPPIDPRLLEQALARNNRNQEGSGRSGGGGGGGSGSGGGGGGGGGAPSSNNFGSNQNFQPPQNFNPPNANNNNGSQGFANFSQFQNQRKEEDKKPAFSIPTPKVNSDLDLPKVDAKSKASAKLPEVQSPSNATKTQGAGMIPSNPVALMPNSLANTAAGGSQNGAGMGGGMGGDMGGGMGGGMMAGMGMGMGGGMGGNSGFGGGGGDLGFDVGGSSDDYSEDEEGPRYRVFSVPMSGGSGGGGESGSIIDNSTGLSGENIKKSKNSESYESIYFLSNEEENLKDVPGIFRSLASGYRKTRVQNLCGFSQVKEIGICKKRSSQSDG